MNLNKKLLILLAIFCLIASAGFVCAADYSDSGNNSQDEILLGVSNDEHVGVDSDIPQDDANQQTLEPGAGLSLENQTGLSDNSTGNVTDNTAGNTTGNATSNVTANTTEIAISNATAHHRLLATGNPVIALLAVSFIIGGYAVMKRNE